MPIKVACACGAAFAAKDELAGRTVACPKCKQPLKIPAPQAAAVAPQAPHANAGLFDDVGLKARDTTVPRCPSCAAEMAPNAILCIKCGFNTKLGKRMQTINMAADPNAAPAGGGGGHGGHGGDVTAMIMARAAKNAEDDVEEEEDADWEEVEDDWEEETEEDDDLEEEEDDLEEEEDDEWDDEDDDDDDLEEDDEEDEEWD